MRTFYFLPGYLSDGDSPELLPRQQVTDLTNFQEAPCDVGSFRLYVGSDPSRCSQRVTGLLTVHLLGLEEMKNSRLEDSKEIFLAIQVDGVTRARTALLTLRGHALPLNHTFHLDLERAQQLRIVVLTPGSRSQQLCLKLEPRGLLYVKLTLQEKWDTQVVGLYRLCGSAAVKKELRDWFEKNSSAVCLSEDLYPDINVITGILKDYLRELPSPLITRTLYQVVREAMTQRSLPETPDPEVAQCTVKLLSCLPEPEKATLSLLLDHLSLVASFSSFNRMTHQNLAVCFGPVLLTPAQEACRGGGERGAGRAGRGTGKAFGPGEEMANAVDFKRHIEALHYLLQLWPGDTLPSLTHCGLIQNIHILHSSCSPSVPTHRVLADNSSPPSSATLTQQLQLQPHLQHHPNLRLTLLPNVEEEVVVSRRGRGGLARLESPPPVNRYAGDWTICGQNLLSEHEADYDEVAGSEGEGGKILRSREVLLNSSDFNLWLHVNDKEKNTT
ncbi:hypothetical protein GOODEAATRI_007710 [Goodea atripinnis]|uniref:Rho-GAP domain-containing protein n=1 Tax=Goodea atripinnis TaxID=208336 RepID=A0ABV0PW68_9TELE